MKKITNSIIVLLLIGMMSSCSETEEPTPDTTTVNNKFTLDGLDYNTSHCYFYVSFGAPYKNLFTIHLLESEMYYNGLGAAYYTDNTSHVLTLNHYVSSNPMPSINDVIMNGTFQPRVASRGALLTTNITDWEVEANIAGRDVGYPVQAIDNPLTPNSFIYPHQTNPGTFTISNLVIDQATLTGTMDLTYTVIGNNNEVIEGSYSGAFTILRGGT